MLKFAGKSNEMCAFIDGLLKTYGNITLGELQRRMHLEKNDKCSICGEVAQQNGQVYYVDGQLMCLPCYEKNVNTEDYQ